MKKTLCLVLTLIFVLASLATVSVSAITAKKPSGTGTEADPYIIKTAAEFNWIANNGKTIGTAGTTASATIGRTVYMELGADVDLYGASVALVEDLGWSDVKGSKNEWHFNGKGHTISNMTNMLFVSIQANSVIENINFVNIQLTDATSNVGMIVGYAPKGVTLKNIVIDPTSVMTASNANHAGALVGLSQGETVIENCLNAATVSNTKNSATADTGAMLAAIESKAATIKNCVNIGEITGSGITGGILGTCAASATGTKIENCVNIGKVKGQCSAATPVIDEICATAATNNAPYTKTGCYLAADKDAKYTEIRAIVATTHACVAETNDCEMPCTLCSLSLVATGHTYTNGCDTTCDVCNVERIPEKHLYDNACDATCNVCGAERTSGEHIYDHALDTICNVCSAEKVEEPEDTTAAPDTTAAGEDDGCGSALNSTYAILALVAVLGFAFVAKKREEN